MASTSHEGITEQLVRWIHGTASGQVSRGGNLVAVSRIPLMLLLISLDPKGQCIGMPHPFLRMSLGMNRLHTVLLG